MKRFLVTLLFVTLMLSLCTFTVFAAGEGEPNDKKANATSIPLERKLLGISVNLQIKTGLNLPRQEMDILPLILSMK